jgi:hypothetical protein
MSDEKQALKHNEEELEKLDRAVNKKLETIIEDCERAGATVDKKEEKRD